MDKKQKYEQALAQQWARNKEVWKTLLNNGFKPDSEVRLDFFYYGPSRVDMERLRDYLRAETDYESDLKESGGRWSLCGHTQPTKISLEIVDQWVDWMLSAGLQFNCEFDGWGTEI